MQLPTPIPERYQHIMSPSELGRALGVTRQRAHQILNRPDHRARVAVKNAVRTGRLVRPSHCEECAAPARLQAHHPDYSKRLDVLWVCAPCHVKVHPHHPYARSR